ncbi:MAG TPA: helix-turn-helix domain-containing protein [Burkholderiaceae bacterium]|nr:helix-turn-helix domain-containing protein [Burkholderiaceae bacterium]
MTKNPPIKVSFKTQMLLARQDAIIRSVNSMLAQKGFDAMTVDEVAADVGIAKASLYKHFPSKEDLAAAAMVFVMRRAQHYLDELSTEATPFEKIKQVVRWVMSLKLAGEMPSLPSQNSSLRTTLMNNKDYMDGLMDVSDRLGAWIEAAQVQGDISNKLPAIAVLYTLYARACDPVLEFLKMGDLYNDDQVIDLVMATCFDGINAR